MPSIHLLTVIAALASPGVAATAPAAAQLRATAPEPATWSSLLLGFGALGAVLRRRPARAGATLI